VGKGELVTLPLFSLPLPDMGDTNYSLNIDNLLEYLNCAAAKGKYLHNRLGIEDNRARKISLTAYNIVWDEIEQGEEFNTIQTIIKLLKAAKENNYNDTEIAFYLYCGFSEIDAFVNPDRDNDDKPQKSKEDNLFLN